MKIWKYVAQQPRVVEIRHKKEKSRYGSQEYSSRLHGRHRSPDGGRYSPEESDGEFRVYSNPPPAILHINQESRYEGLKFYRLGSLNDAQYPTYLSVSNDIIFLIFNPKQQDRHGLSRDFSLGDEGCWNPYLNRIAVPMDAIRLREDDNRDTWWADHFRFNEVKEIIPVDHSATKHRESNGSSHSCLSLNLNLTTLTPLDLVKKCVNYGPRYPRHSDYEPEVRDLEVISVHEYLVEVRDEIIKPQKERTERRKARDGEDTNGKKAEDGEDQAVVLYDPILTVMRTKFKDGADGKEPADGVRQIYLL